MHPPEPSLEDKVVFFRELDELNKLSDSDDDHHQGACDETEKERQRWEQALRCRTDRASKRPASHTDPLSLSPGGNVPSSRPAAGAGESFEQVTTPTIERIPVPEIETPVNRRDGLIHSQDARGPNTVDTVNASRIPDSARAPLNPPRRTRSVSTPTPNPLVKRLFPPRPTASATITAMATSTRKRKRDAAIKLVPEDQQIFKGLAFYFIPNDDIAPARRIRIRKAQEYGATWTRVLKQASHVIVDKSLCWKNIEPILSSANGAPSAVLVNETYPLDCIQFRTLLNPNQNQYYVRGSPDLPLKERPPEESAAALARVDSLPFKSVPTNSKRWDYLARPGTPPSRDNETDEKRNGTNGKGEKRNDEGGQKAGGPSPQHRPSPVTRHSTVERRDAGNGERNTGRSDTGSLRRDDELTEYISQMQKLRGLPLEEEEDEKGETGPHNGSESSEHESEDESHRSQKKQKRPARSGNRKDITWEDRFACHRASANDSHRGNPNARTIEILQQMCDYYSRTNDTWRSLAYRKVISLLKRQQTKITTADEAVRLPGVGKRLADKIEEIVATDRLQRLENASNDPADQALQQFLKIYGVGSTQAARWVAQGYRTLDDLREKAKLTGPQRLGIDHFDDLNTRIPRWEVEALAGVVRATAATVDADMKLIVGGSYRRGADSSGDIDFILTKPGTSSVSELLPLLHGLTRALEAQGVLVATLSATRSDARDGSGKWHGCCVLPLEMASNAAAAAAADGAPSSPPRSRPIWRRIDFLAVPETELGAALIYFTGNDIFNRSMRLLASKKGMRLNQRGLYRDVLLGPGRAKVTDGELIEGRDERRIFEILGVQWREPHERWC